MLVSYRTIEEAAQAIARLHKECQLPVVEAIRLKKIIKRLKEELDVFSEMKKELFERYAEKNEDGSNVTKRIKNPDGSETEYLALRHPDKFHSAFEELCSQEVNVAYEGISVKLLGDFKMSSSEADSLSFLILEE